jgi:hypothetical protein
LTNYSGNALKFSATEESTNGGFQATSFLTSDISLRFLENALVQFITSIFNEIKFLQ